MPRQRQTFLETNWQQVTAVALGVLFILILLVIAVLVPDPQPFSIFVFRVVLSLAAGGIGAVVPGYIQVNISRWVRAGGAIALFVIVYAVNPPVLVTANNTAAPLPPNKETKVLVIDSYVRRYDQTKKVTNADFLTDFAQSVGATIRKKVDARHILVEPGYAHFDFVLEKSPDLMIIHMSSFFGSNNTTIDPKEFTQAMVEFQTFVRYMLDNNKELRLLVYTREIPDRGEWTKEIHTLVLDNLVSQKRFLKGLSPRATVLMLPWDAKFTDPKVAAATRQAIRQALQSL